MPDVKLTPVERGALFALMAEGRPLRENELEAHGVNIRKPHRDKLKKLGFVETATKPFTHTITEKGRKRIFDELAAPQAGDHAGLRPLSALLQGVLRKNGLNLADALRDTGKERDPIGRKHIERAAWSDADEALAQALQDMSVFYRWIKRLHEMAPDHLSPTIEQVEFAADLVFQPVRRAARQRQLSFATEEGGETAYDPVLHRADEKLKLGTAVKVRKAPVIRGPAKLGVVVLSGEVEPV